MNENEDGGFEVEASPTFFSSSSGGGLVEEDEDDIEQLPQQDDESTMNDESTIAASSYISRGYSYVASNTKWFVIAMASFTVFFGIGIGLGYGPIGNKIYGGESSHLPLKINTAGVMSMKIPTNSSKILIMKRIIILLSLMFNKKSLRFCGMFS